MLWNLDTFIYAYLGTYKLRYNISYSNDEGYDDIIAANFTLAIGDNVYNLSDKESTIIIDGINYEYSPVTINAEITVSDVCLQ